MMALMELKPDEEPVVIAIDSNEIKRVPLNACIEKINEQREAFSKGDVNLVIKLRGR